MAVRHLSEEEIQSYLDGNISYDSDAARHLKTCPACRRELQLYQRVYEGLDKDNGFEQAAGFAESVMSRLETASQNVSRSGITSILLVVLGCFTIIGAAWYSFAVTSFAEKLRTFSGVFAQYTSDIVGMFVAIAVDSGVNAGLVLYTGLILVTFAVLDRLLVRWRGGHICV